MVDRVSDFPPAKVLKRVTSNLDQRQERPLLRNCEGSPIKDEAPTLYPAGLPCPQYQSGTNSIPGADEFLEPHGNAKIFAQHTFHGRCGDWARSEQPGVETGDFRRHRVIRPAWSETGWPQTAQRAQ